MSLSLFCFVYLLLEVGALRCDLYTQWDSIEENQYFLCQSYQLVTVCVVGTASCSDSCRPCECCPCATFVCRLVTSTKSCLHAVTHVPWLLWPLYFFFHKDLWNMTSRWWREALKYWLCQCLQLWILSGWGSLYFFHLLMMPVQGTVP